jgi:oligosaccharide reducing-end xylanase
MMKKLLVILSLVSALLAGCTSTATPTAAMTSQSTVQAGAFATNEYRNLFKEYLGKSDAEVQAKIEAAWNQLFYGDDDNERVYYPAGEDMAYIVDIGNNDVRSEGMSYGMMIAVQLDKKEEFDRLWKWTKTYMYQSEGPYQGYFAWHCTRDGIQLDANPASDGEEWFAMTLFFASARWGDGEGIFDYRAQAQEILDVMLHKEDESSGIATNMFDREEKQVVFVPITGRLSSFSDPSYHLPAYYELWARWAERDNQFWS